MTKQDFLKHVGEIKEFLKDQDYIQDLYEIKGLETRKASIEFLGDNLIQPLRLCSLTIQYALFDSADKAHAKIKHQVQRMQLIAAFLQGLFVSTDLILEGNYIKASATLKQDYEIMTRLNEICNGKSKYGKVPNPQHGLPTMKKIYGYLNNIAHISKDDILDSLLLYTDKNDITGFSPVKKIQKKYLNDLFIYDSFIKLEVLRHCLILHQELLGEDETYKKALAYYNVVIKIYASNPIVENLPDK